MSQLDRVSAHSNLMGISAGVSAYQLLRPCDRCEGDNGDGRDHGDDYGDYDDDGNDGDDDDDSRHPIPPSADTHAIIYPSGLPGADPASAAAAPPRGRRRAGVAGLVRVGRRSA
eukprot:6234809-Pyramimonas_sp.AAC.1